jgi:hypothetical protein
MLNIKTLNYFCHAVHTEIMVSQISEICSWCYFAGGCNWQEVVGDAVAPLSSVDSLVSCQ